MKKLMYLLIIGILAVMITGCGMSESEKKQDAEKWDKVASITEMEIRNGFQEYVNVIKEIKEQDDKISPTQKESYKKRLEDIEKKQNGIADLIDSDFEIDSDNDSYEAKKVQEKADKLKEIASKIADASADLSDIIEDSSEKMSKKDSANIMETLKEIAEDFKSLDKK